MFSINGSKGTNLPSQFNPSKVPPVKIKVDDVRELMGFLHKSNDLPTSLELEEAREGSAPVSKLALPAMAPLSRGKIYQLLLLRGDSNFLKSTYLLLLGRLPDPTGSHSLMKELASGHLYRIDLLLTMALSQESKLKSTSLSLSHFEVKLIRKHELLVQSLSKLRWYKTCRKISKSLSLWRVRDATITDNFSDSLIPLQRNLALIARALGHLRESVRTSQIEQSDLIRDINQLKRAATDAGENLQALLQDSKITSQALEKIRLNQVSLDDSLIRIKARQNTLESRLSKATAPSQEALARPNTPASLANLDKNAVETELTLSNRFDSYYFEFEKTFRGEESEVKARLSYYLNYLDAALGPILDLGCGRGEWLELLQENAYQAYGIDTNEAAIIRCRKKNLSCQFGDGLAHLRSLPESSLGAITGFHIAEHLPWELVLELIEESFRVLKPSGRLILETPNPENILVGSLYFYHDPTHKNPIVPSVLQFTVKYFGFTDVDILRFRPTAHLARMQNQDWALPLLNSFNAPQDFAVTGRKGEI